MEQYRKTKFKQTKSYSNEMSEYRTETSLNTFVIYTILFLSHIAKYDAFVYHTERSFALVSRDANEGMAVTLGDYGFVKETETLR